jgi:hypothetical protein
MEDGEKGQPKPKKNKMPFIVAGILVVIGIVVAVIFATGSSSDADQDFCNQCGTNSCN